MIYNLESTSMCDIKYKIVFLGNMSVGKSSIIERFINGRFEEARQVSIFSCRIPWVLISYPKMYNTNTIPIDSSSGIPQANKNSAVSSPPIFATPTVL
jgi:GTPase SAR1 family protein